MNGFRRERSDSMWLAVLFAVLAVPMLAWGDAGVLQVLVQDAQKHPVKGVEMGLEGGGGSRTTGDDGKVLLPLPKDTSENDWVSLQIIRSPTGKDWQMVSPWDSRYLVPSFKNKPENFVRVVVVQRGDRAALESGSVLAALTAKINRANAPQSPDKQQTEDPKASLNAVAKQFGLTPGELDKAIRAWGEKTTDPYEAGLAALYARNYDAATTSLQASLKQREEKFATAQKDVADATFFLGFSLFEQGRYRESAEAYERCLQLRPNDPTVLNNTGLSLGLAGDYGAAEPLLRRSLAQENQLGPSHPLVATSLNNLAELFQAKGDYAEAEPLLRRALAIREKASGPDQLELAYYLNNLGARYRVERDYTAAEPLLRRALAIREKASGPDQADVGTSLNNLALLLYAKGDYAAADPLFRRALAIEEKALGVGHPLVATVLNNMASLSKARGDYATANQLYRRSLAIREKALGPDHPDVATSLNNLAELLRAEKDYAGGEQLCRRALEIREKALGPNHPDLGTSVDNLGGFLYARRDYAGAEPLMKRALAIQEKAFGPDHPAVATILNNLGLLLYAERDYSGAGPLFQRALAIDEKAVPLQCPQIPCI